MEKTLRLERRGCEYFAPDKDRDDVGNYRVGSYDYSIKGKDGRDYIVEFGANNYRVWRTTNKRTGAPLKKPHEEIVKANALYIDTEYEKDEPDGWRSAWRNSTLEHDIREMRLDYSQAGILAAVNEISKDHYTKIEWIK